MGCHSDKYSSQEEDIDEILQDHVFNKTKSANW